MKFVRLLVLVSLLGLATALAATAQHGAPGGEWVSYHGEQGSSQYTALSQINAANVKDLRQVWMWESPDNALIASNSGLRTGGFKSTPLMVNGQLYVNTSLEQVTAIDAASGETM